jgi:acetoin utilization protein AcuC
VHGAQSPVKLPPLMRDDPANYPPTAHASEIADRNHRTTEELMEKVMPLIRQGAAP